MVEPLAFSQQRSSTGGKETVLAAPLLYLSSDQVGWEGLKAEAFHEPSELEGWIVAPESDMAVILFTGGGMRLEQRYPNGPWKGVAMHHGELMLRSVVDVAYEVRWKSVSSVPTQTLHLHLSNELFRQTAEEVADYDYTHLSFGKRGGVQDPLLAQIGFALWRELEQPSSAGKLYAQTAAQMLAVHLLRYYTSASAGRGWKEIAQGLTSQQMKRVVDFVQEHLSQDLSLETLARHVGFSSYHFARLFRQTTGESPHQFLVRQRIERAQHLLKDGRASLAQVALETGFANQSHLTRVFKQQLGLTPRAYRQESAI